MTDDLIRGLFDNTLDKQNERCSKTGLPLSAHEAILFEIEGGDTRWAVAADQVPDFEDVPDDVTYWVGADYFGTEPDLNDSAWYDPVEDYEPNPYDGTYSEE